MGTGEIVSIISFSVTLLLGILVFRTNSRAETTSEKRTSLEERQAHTNREDLVAERRRVELERVYDRVEKLEKLVEGLQKSDRQNQATIDNQAFDLSRTNDMLGEVRDLFTDFISQVERAWAGGHTMPQLTESEIDLLEKTIPYRAQP